MSSAMKAFGALMALYLGLAGLAQADRKSRYDGGAVEAREHGYEHGYRDGLHEGSKDHGGKFKPDVKDADAGYEKFMGDKGQYKEGYRSGFQAGYDDGFYNRNARFRELYGPSDEAYRARGSADRYDDVYVER